MGPKEFHNFVTSIYGENPERGWQLDLADKIRISQGMISRVYNGKASSPKLGRQVRAALDAGVFDEVRAPSPLRAVAPTEPGLVLEAPSCKVEDEDEDEVLERIASRFETMYRVVEFTAEGNMPSAIVSGPPGCGKSYPITRIVDAVVGEENYARFVGSVSPVKLYTTLYKHNGGVIVFDDCDSVLRDPESLNLLKGALDSSDRRIITWLKASNVLKSEDIPDSFEFTGSVIFITNVDLDEAIAKGNKLSPHIEAIVSRSFHVDLAIKSRRDMLIRIRDMVITHDMISDLVDDITALEILEYMEEHLEDFKTPPSLRMVRKIAGYANISPRHWKQDVAAAFVGSTNCSS